MQWRDDTTLLSRGLSRGQPKGGSPQGPAQEGASPEVRVAPTPGKASLGLPWGFGQREPREGLNWAGVGRGSPHPWKPSRMGSPASLAVGATVGYPVHAPET